jgi:enoyl-CoA hydratase
MMQLTRRGRVAVLTMAHGKANAMDLEFCADFTRRLEECAAPDISAVVITGQGRIFSAGVDLLRVVDGGADYVRAFLPALGRVFDALFAFEKPVVAAINGHAIAGGCILACAADRRFIAQTATIGVPELLVGVPFPVVALEILRFAASPQHLQPLVYGGAALPAEAAVAQGLADAAVEPVALPRRAQTVADALAAIPAAAFATMKRQLRTPALQRMRDAAPQVDPAVVDVWVSPGTLRAIREYVERTFKKPS